MKIAMLLLVLSFGLIANSQFVTDTAKASNAKGSTKIRLTKPIKGLTIGAVVIITNNAKRGEIGYRNWPEKIYATKSEMMKDTTRPNRGWASNMTDRKVYMFDKDFNMWNPVSRMDYYLDSILPQADRFKVLAISKDKRTLTLNRKLPIKSTRSYVYVDNTAAFYDRVARDRDKGVIDFTDVVGRVAIGERVEIGRLKNVTIKGAGKDKTIFFSPDGSPSISFMITEAEHLIVDGIGFAGNHKANGFGFIPDHAGVPVHTYGYNEKGEMVVKGGIQQTGAITQVGWFENPVVFVPCLLTYAPNTSEGHITVQNCKMTNAFYPWKGSGNNIHFKNSEVFIESQWNYTDWPILLDGCDSNSSVEDVVFTAQKMSRAIEILKGEGKIKNVVINNGYIAVNSGTPYIDGIRVNITDKSYNPYLKGLPIFDLNQRLEGSANRIGGYLNNIIINNQDDNHHYAGIVLSQGSKNYFIKDYTYIKSDAKDPGIVPTGLQAVADGLVLENINIYGRIGAAYTPVYVDPYHTSIGLLGTGTATLKNIKAEYLSYYTNANIRLENVQAEIIKR